MLMQVMLGISHVLAGFLAGMMGITFPALRFLPILLRPNLTLEYQKQVILPALTQSTGSIFPM